MTHARIENFVLVTQDLDFTTMLAYTHERKPSIVQIRADDTSPEAIGRAVVQAIRQEGNALHAGALLTIDTKRSRLRLLPL